MFASTFDHPRAKAATVQPTFLKRISRGTLAVVLFVALALLGNFGSKESETKWSVPSTVQTTQTTRNTSPYQGQARR
jgi:hypothetical protein